MQLDVVLIGAPPETGSRVAPRPVLLDHPIETRDL